MANNRIELGHGSAFPGSRKLLAGRAEPTPASLAPGPGSAGRLCRDMRTGAVVSCRNPHTLVIIVVGMSCMMFLVTVALILLCYSIVRQRRRERRHVREREESALHPGSAVALQSAPVDSPEYDDAVLVQLPGDEKPQLFALPKPFLANGDHKETKKLADSGAGNDPSGEKDSSEAPPAGDPQPNPDPRSPCVQTSDHDLPIENNLDEDAKHV